MRYIVTLEEIVHYDLDIDADNEDDAEQKALALWCDSPDPQGEFGGQGLGCEAVNFEVKSHETQNIHPHDL
jgi:hypothetical protein